MWQAKSVAALTRTFSNPGSRRSGGSGSRWAASSAGCSLSSDRNQGSPTSCHRWCQLTVRTQLSRWCFLWLTSRRTPALKQNNHGYIFFSTGNCTLWEIMQLRAFSHTRQTNLLVSCGLNHAICWLATTTSDSAKFGTNFLFLSKHHYKIRSENEGAKHIGRDRLSVTMPAWVK